jgi:hypothetical protein
MMGLHTPTYVHRRKVFLASRYELWAFEASNLGERGPHSMCFLLSPIHSESRDLSSIFRQC